MITENSKRMLTKLLYEHSEQKYVYKTLLPVACTVGLFILAFAFMMVSFRAHIIKEKKIKIRELVETAWAVLDEYNNQVTRGEKTLELAQKRAIHLTSQLRYGNEMKDYFWVIDMSPKLIMHPYLNLQYGSDLSESKDLEGNLLFIAMRDIAATKGAGYHTYFWQWKDDPKKNAAKISYIKRFEPWDWIIGTGIYVEEVDAELYNFSMKILICYLVIFILVVLLSASVVYQEKGVEEARNEAVSALKDSEQMLRNITDTARDAIIEIDDTGKITFWNPGAEKLTGHFAPDVMGKEFHHLIIDKKYIKDFERGFEKFQESGHGPAIGRITQWDIIHKNGAKIPVELSLSRPVKNAGGWKAVGILRDISDRIKAEKALKESEEMFKALAEQSTDVIMRFNPQGEHIYANPRCKDLFGIHSKDVLNKTHRQLVGLFPETGLTADLVHTLETTILRVFQSGEPVRIEFELADKSFDWVVIPEKSEDGSVLSVMASARDITEFKVLNQKLNQSYKMEAIGTLAGGIAHDFNNILSPIIMGAEIISSKTDTFDADYDVIDQIYRSGLRGKELVKQILYYSRQNEEEKHTIHLMEIVNEASKLLRSSLPSTIEITLHQNSEEDVIDANAVQIQQVVMNLSTNAAHAMREKGGKLEISIENVQIHPKGRMPQEDMLPGQYVTLSIRDTGHGIAPQILAKIYDPFFTTKPSGEGTGMGLSVVHGIIKNHKGYIFVESEVNKGTVFTIYFPKTEKQILPAEAEKKEDLNVGSERILLVDDEASIVKMLKIALERIGYVVEGFSDVREALQTFKASSHRFDLVITDQTMPHMTGLEFSGQLTTIRPDIPVILCSGYDEGLEPDRLKENGIRHLILKPVTMSELGKTLKRILS